MDVINASVKWQFVLVYLDNITIFSKSPSEHVEHTHQVLHLLSDDGVTLKLKIYSIFTDTIDYFGHIILPGVLEVETQTPDAIPTLK